MERFNPSTLVKWRPLDKIQRLDAVLKRLQAIEQNTPANLVPLLRYGMTSTHLQLVFTKFDLPSLHHVKNQLSPTERQHIQHLLRETQRTWRNQNFIHGDLSPRNILIDLNGPLQLFFVDWVLDLESFEATPQYASKEVYQKRRTWFSDQYSTDILCKEIRQC